MNKREEWIEGVFLWELINVVNMKEYIKDECDVDEYERFTRQRLGRLYDKRGNHD